MKYTKLGNSGLKVSKICFGCMSIGQRGAGFEWAVDETEGRRLIKLALENGINFFDTANMYAYGTSEQYLGRALKDLANRDEVVIATKCFFHWGRGPNQSRLSRKAIYNQVEGSLKRLGTDYIDLYQIHRLDEDTPIEETMEALHDLIKEGKVRYIGASSMFAYQFLTAQNVAEKHGWTKFISMQNQVSLLYREEEREMMQLCRETNVGVIPWSPLARGRLTRDIDATSLRLEKDHVKFGYYEDMSEDEAAVCRVSDDKVIRETHAVAAERGVTRAEVGLAWLLAKPEMAAPIVGVAKDNHITDAVAATELELTADEIARLEKHYIPHPFIQVGADAMPRFKFKVTVKD